MKLSLLQLTNVVADWIQANKIAIDGFTATNNNISGMVDQIGKIYTNETNFGDYLPQFDGEPLPLGKTIEEYYFDLILPVAHDANGSDTLAPHYATARPASFSYTEGEKDIPSSIPYNNLERAVHNEAQYAELIASLTKRLYDSFSVAKFNIKKQALAVLSAKCQEEQGSITTYAVSTAYAINTCLQSTASSGIYGIVVKAITATSYASYNTLADNVANGYIIILDLVQTISKPVDTLTSEAWITQVKKDVETASFPSEGHSLNGNTIGATDGLILVVKKGIMPVVEVSAWAGAFNKELLALPAEIVKVDDFGNDATGTYAILMDVRGMRIHQDYLSVLEQLNAQGHFMNYWLHYELTAHISKNTFVKIYKA